MKLNKHFSIQVTAEINLVYRSSKALNIKFKKN